MIKQYQCITLEADLLQTKKFIVQLKYKYQTKKRLIYSNKCSF